MNELRPVKHLRNKGLILSLALAAVAGDGSSQPPLNTTPSDGLTDDCISKHLDQKNRKHGAIISDYPNKSLQMLTRDDHRPALLFPRQRLCRDDPRTMLRPTVAVASLPPSPSPEHPGMPGAQSGSVQELGATPPSTQNLQRGTSWESFLELKLQGHIPTNK